MDIKKGNIRAFAFVLIIALVMSLMPVNVYAHVGLEGGKDIQPDVSNGKYVYFGGGESYNALANGKPNNTTLVYNISWRIVDQDDETITLFSNDTIAKRPYNPTEGTGTTALMNVNRNWSESQMCKWLNGGVYTSSRGPNSAAYESEDFYETGFYATAFESDADKNAIVPYGDPGETETNSVNGKTIEIDQKIVLPSYDELMTDWGMSQAQRQNTSKTAYWTRSPYSSDSQSYSITGTGTPNFLNASSVQIVRPVLKLSRDAILFTSDAIGDYTKHKIPVGRNLTAIGEPQAAQAFTIIDEQNLKLSSAEVTSKTGKNLNISYKGTPGKILSVAVRNKTNDKVLYYGKLVESASESGTTSMTLPDNFDAEKHKVIIFLEEGSVDWGTDYASKPLPLEIPTKADVSGAQYSAPVTSTAIYGTSLGGISISQSAVTVDGDPVAGEWNWTSQNAIQTIFDVGDYNQNATFTPDDNSGYTGSITTKVAVTINKATPTVDTSPVINIKYGDKLTGDLFDGTNYSVKNFGENVTGTWSWGSNLGVSPSFGNNQAYTAIFTPDSAGAQKASNYNPTTASIIVNVGQGVSKVIKAPEVQGIPYGTKLGQITSDKFTGGIVSVAGIGVINGTWKYTDTNTEPTVGTHTTYNAEFTPTDSTKYTTVSSVANLTVVKTVPMITTTPTATDITYGQSLSNSTLQNGVGSVAGTFDWKDNTITPTSAGKPTYRAIFKPTNPGYDDIEFDLDIKVNKASLRNIVTSATDIKYGQKLMASTISGNAKGVFNEDISIMATWSDPSEVPSSTGSWSSNAIITPISNLNYTTQSAIVNVLVDKGDPELVTNPSANDINYGDPLSTTSPVGGYVSFGGIKIGGSWDWASSVNTSDIPNLGTATYDVVFTPSNPNLNIVNGKVDVRTKLGSYNVTTSPSATDITYGSILSSSTLSGGVVTYGSGQTSKTVNGSFDWTDDTVKPTVGSGPYEAIFTPNDPSLNLPNLPTLPAMVNITVNKAIPGFDSDPEAYSINIGQKLSDSTITANMSYQETQVKGTATWKNENIVATKTGILTSTAIFTPDSTDAYAKNFKTREFQLGVNVVSNTVPQIAEPPAGTGVKVGETLAASNVSGGKVQVGAHVFNGYFKWENPSTKVLTRGSQGKHTGTVEFVFSDNDYSGTKVVTQIAITVDKGISAVIDAPTVKNVAYGTTLGAIKSSQFNDGVVSVAGIGVVNGSWAFDASVQNTRPNYGTTTKYKATFTPTQGDDYTVVSTDVAITVDKALPSSSGAIEAADITYGQSLQSTTISGITYKDLDGKTLSGSWEYLSIDSTSISNVSSITPATGTYTLKVKFTPSDNNYKAVTETVALKVNKATPQVTIPSNSGLTYKDDMSKLVFGSFTQKGVLTDTLNGTWKSIYTGNTLDVDTHNIPIEYNVDNANSDNYKSVTSVTAITISKATPKVTKNPSVSAIKAGDKLSVSNITNNGTVSYKDDTLTGSYKWDDASKNKIAQSVGTITGRAIFTPNGIYTKNYNETSVVLTVDVEQADPQIVKAPTGTSIKVGQKLSDSKLSFQLGMVKAGSENVDGKFEWKNLNKTIESTNEREHDVVFKPLDTASYGSSATTKVAINIDKGDSVIMNVPTVNNIEFGSSLGAIKPNQFIDGVVSVAGIGVINGNWSFDNKTDIPNANNSPQMYKATFVSTRSDDYTPVSTNVAITIDKAMVVSSGAINASDITYGQSLESTTISGITYKDLDGKTLNGSWEYLSIDSTSISNVSSITPDAGTYKLKVKFIPSDNNYNTATEVVDLKVNKATPQVTVPTNSGLTYKDDMSSLVFGNFTQKGVLTDTLNGTWKSTYTGSALDVDTHDIPIEYNVDSANSDNYKSVTSMTAITISKATPKVTKNPSLSAIKAGDKLSVSEFINNGSVSYKDDNLKGGFKWDDASKDKIAQSVGTITGRAIFTPSGDYVKNYNETSVVLTVDVEQADPEIVKAPTGTSIKVGQKLSDSKLSFQLGMVKAGSENVDGEFEWKNLNKIIESTNEREHDVIFKPIDTASYGSGATTKVAITIEKGDSVVMTTPTVSSITYGTSLGAIKSNQFNDGSVSVAGIGLINGDWAFDSSIGNITPDVGTTTKYDVIFTPDDKDAYTTTKTSISVNVLPIKPTKGKGEVTISAIDGDIEYGITAGGLTISGITYSGIDGTELTGSWSLADEDGNLISAGKEFEAGEHNIKVIFTPDSNNYIPAETDLVLVVEKSGPKRVDGNLTVSAIDGELEYGSTIGGITISGVEYIDNDGNALTGTWTFEDENGNPIDPSKIFDAGENNMVAIFTPDDDNYSPIKNDVIFTVDKATPMIISNPSASAIAVGAPLVESELTGGGVAWMDKSVEGKFEWEDETITADAIGTMPAIVQFVPDDDDNYNTTSTSIVVNIIPGELEIVEAPVGSQIIVGEIISKSALNYKDGMVKAGDTTIKGEFKWSEPTTVAIKGGVSFYEAEFIPENEIYESVTTLASIEVEKADPIVIEAPTADSVVHGIKLGDIGTSAINGGVVSVAGIGIIEGSYVYLDSKEIPDVGTHTLEVLFIPDDRTSFNYARTYVDLTVLESEYPLIESITLNKNSTVLNSGDELTLKATIYPEESTATDVTWNSSDNNIATVDKYGVVKARDTEGEVIISAKAKDGSGKSATCTVKVAQNVTKIRTPMSTYNISKKKSIKVPVVCDSGSKKTVSSKLTVKSSNKKIATVSVKGNTVTIKAKKKKGKTKITITSANGMKKVLTIKVSKKKVKLKKIKIKGLKKKYKKGKTAQIKIICKSKKATNLKVKYKSSKKSVATVDKAGKVTFKKKGKVKITIKVGKKTVKKKIKVKN